MAPPEMIDPAVFAAMAQDVSCTAQDTEGLVKATAGPRGRIDEITVAAELHDVGAETAAGEILAVVNEAQRLADAEFNRQVQERITAFMASTKGNPA